MFMENHTGYAHLILNKSNYEMVNDGKDGVGSHALGLHQGMDAKKGHQNFN